MILLQIAPGTHPRTDAKLLSDILACVSGLFSAPDARQMITYLYPSHKIISVNEHTRRRKTEAMQSLIGCVAGQIVVNDKMLYLPMTFCAVFSD